MKQQNQKPSQATLAYLAAYWKMLHYSEETCVIFQDSFHKECGKLIDYTVYFSDEMVDCFDLDDIAPNDDIIDPEFVDGMIKLEGGNIVPEQYQISVRENPHKWVKIYANYCYGSGHNLYFSDYLSGETTTLSPIYEHIVYQSICSVILAGKWASFDCEQWEEFLEPHHWHAKEIYEAFEELKQEVHLLLSGNYLLVPIPLSPEEWTQTDEVVKVPAAPIKVTVVDRSLVNYVTLGLECDTPIIESLFWTGALTTKNE